MRRVKLIFQSTNTLEKIAKMKEVLIGFDRYNEGLVVACKVYIVGSSDFKGQRVLTSAVQKVLTQ